LNAHKARARTLNLFTCGMLAAHGDAYEARLNWAVIRDLADDPRW
jgi:hypothetical protein